MQQLPANPTIAIVNRTTVLSDEECTPVVAACAVQITRDFAVYYGVKAELIYFGKTNAPPDAWLVGLFDTADQAGALGYHDFTIRGNPLGKVFVRTTRQYGGQWSCTLSHELLEMLADPDIQRCVQVGSMLYAQEICDPCEADADGYNVGDVLMSDFILPAWFDVHGPSDRQFDFARRIRRPLAIRPEGYMSVLDLRGAGGWTQLNANEPSPSFAAHTARAHVGSRRERRRTPREQWLRSNAG